MEQKMYQPIITVQKGTEGVVDGAISAMVGITSVVSSTYIMSKLPPEVRAVISADQLNNIISISVGAVVTAITTGVTRMLRNWIKHKN